MNTDPKHCFQGQVPFKFVCDSNGGQKSLPAGGGVPTVDALSAVRVAGVGVPVTLKHEAQL